MQTQLSESKANPQAIPTGRRCTVCAHSDISAINSLLASATLSNRGIALQFGLSNRAVDDHAKKHLPVKIARAAERKANKSDDLFMQRLEYLWDETTDGVKKAKNAARAVTDPETGELCYISRDLGALAPLLGQAHKNLELLGNATGRLNQAPQITQNNYLSVILPRVEDHSEVIDLKAIDSTDPQSLPTASQE